jgi:hypothetical protein
MFRIRCRFAVQVLTAERVRLWQILLKKPFAPTLRA